MCKNCCGNGYRAGIKIICGCIPSAAARAEIVTITRDGFQPVVISVLDFRYLLAAALHDDVPALPRGGLIVAFLEKLSAESPQN